MSTEVPNLNSYIQQQEVIRCKLLDEIKEWDEKITRRIQDREKKSGEIRQNNVMVAEIRLEFSKSMVPVTDEVKLRHEQKIKPFSDGIEELRKIIHRYDTVDIPRFKENKLKAEAELASVEAKIESMKAIEKVISAPIDTSSLDLSTLENQTTLTFKR